MLRQYYIIVPCTSSNCIQWCSSSWWSWKFRRTGGSLLSLSWLRCNVLLCRVALRCSLANVWILKTWYDWSKHQRDYSRADFHCPSAVLKPVRAHWAWGTPRVWCVYSSTSLVPAGQYYWKLLLSIHVTTANHFYELVLFNERLGSDHLSYRYFLHIFIVPVAGSYCIHDVFENFVPTVFRFHASANRNCCFFLCVALQLKLLCASASNCTGNDAKLPHNVWQASSWLHLPYPDECKRAGHVLCGRHSKVELPWRIHLVLFKVICCLRGVTRVVQHDGGTCIVASRCSYAILQHVD